MRKCVSVIFIFSCLFSSGFSQENNNDNVCLAYDSYLKALQEIDDQKASENGLTDKESELIVANLSSSINKNSSSKVYLELFKVLHNYYFTKGRSEDSRGFIDLINNIKSNDVLIQIAKADGLRRLGCVLESIAVLKKIGDTHYGVVRALAAEGLSDAYLKFVKLDPSLEWMNSAIAETKQVDSYGFSTLTKQRFGHKKEMLVALMDVLKHGIGLQLYTRAREYEQGNNYGDAKKSYQNLLINAEKNRGNDMPAIMRKVMLKGDVTLLNNLSIEPVYEDAAFCYMAKCMIELGEMKEARDVLIGFLQRDRMGAYRGEAFLLLGRIALDNNADPAEAALHFTAVINWVNEVNNLEVVKVNEYKVKYQIPKQSLDRTAGPSQMRYLDNWGNAVWSRPNPDAVINRFTSAWYMDGLLYNAYTQRAICQFLMGHKEMAVQEMELAHKHDSLDCRLMAQGALNNFARLRDGFKNGRFNATPQELSLFKGAQLVALIRVEILFETEQWLEAIAGYQALTRRFGAGLSNAANAYLEYAQASACLYVNKIDAAKKILEGKFVNGPNVYPKSVPSYPRAMIGNCSETSGAFCASAPRGAQFSACFRDEVGERWYQVCFLEPVAEVGKE